MDERFYRGAKVRPKQETPLTIVEATLVVCDVARRDGIMTEREFLELMTKAWRAYSQVCASGDRHE